MYVLLRAHVNKSYRIYKSYRHCHHCLCNPAVTANNRNYHNPWLLRSDDTPRLSNNFKLNTQLIRSIHTSHIYFDKEPLKPSSKVEVTVQELKKAKDEVVEKVPKRTIIQIVKDEIIHYYHGFRLLFIDIKISSKLAWRILQGKTLTRREHRLLTRTVGDMFRLVPFSVFIIVPFMELALPIFLKLFPGMLPSTFQTAKEKEDKIKQSLKVKLEMAKFLQETLDEMAVQNVDRKSEQAKQFVEWFQKVRTSGEYISTEEIMKFSKLFEDEITLDSLSRNQLIALCRVLEVQTLGTNRFLRFQLRLKLRALTADDKMIQKEGIDSLTLAELQQACRARGMRAYGLPEQRLKTQLSQWLDLSLNQRVPPSLLLLSSALMLPETIPTSDKLKATISALPETVVTQTKAAIGEKEGKIDNKVMLEVLKEEERKIKEERLEHIEEKKAAEEVELQREKAEILVDKAPTIEDKAPVLKEITPTETEAKLSAKDVEIIESAIDTISKEKKLFVEKEEIEDLKEEMAAYKEDVDDLQKVVATEPKPQVKESKAAKRLFKHVNKMIGKLDKVLIDLENKEKRLKEDLKAKDTLVDEKSGVKDQDKTKEELLRIDDIIAAIKSIKDVPDQSRLDQIAKVLNKMDDDRDGSLKVEDVLKVIEILGKENVKLSDKQIDELMELIDKEEILEVEEKIEKALQKTVETQNKETPKEPSTDKTKDKSSLQSKETHSKELEDNLKKCTEENASQDPSVKSQTKTDKPSNPSDSTKPKFETKQSIITPPVNSIEKTKDSSKVL